VPLGFTFRLKETIKEVGRKIPAKFYKIKGVLGVWAAEFSGFCRWPEHCCEYARALQERPMTMF
jgi:hypothetical protein